MQRATWLSRVIAALFLLTGSTVTASGQAPSRFQWWHSDRFQKELALSSDQVARIDAVFQATLPDLRQRKEELDRLETQLSRLIETDADEVTVSKLVDKTEAARSGLNRVRTLMLVRMRQVLTPDQRTRFNTLHEERVRERGSKFGRRDSHRSFEPR